MRLTILSLAGFLLPSMLSAQAAGPGFRDVAEGLTAQVSPLSQLLTVGAFLFGIALVFIGLLKFKKFAERPDDGNRPLVAIIFIIAGASVVALPTTINTGIGTLFGGAVPTSNSFGGGTQVLPFSNGNRF